MREVEQWKRTREVCHILYCANRDPKKRFIPIYEFMPLEGDPSEAEQEEMRQEEIKKEGQWLSKVFRKARESGHLN